MWRAKHRSLLRRYGVAVLAVVAGALATHAVAPLFTYRSPALPFTLAVIVSAWYGGLGPGLLATVAGFLVADYFFLPPVYSLLPVHTEDYVLWGLYATVGVVTSFLAGRLSRRNAELVATFSSLTDSLVLINTEGAADVFDSTISSANPAFMEMFGLPSFDAVPKRLREFLDLGGPMRPNGSPLSVEERPAFRAFNGEHIRDMEVRFRRAAGGTWTGSCAAIPVVDAHGKVIAVALAVRDITERKQAEEVLGQRTAQFETLLNAAPLAVYLVDSQLHIRHVNPVAFPVFGDIADLIGRDFDEVIHQLWPKSRADELVERFRVQRLAGV